MKSILLKALFLLAILIAYSVASPAREVDIEFKGNFVTVVLDNKTYFVDVTEQLKNNDVKAILKIVCDKVPETCKK